MNLCHPNTVKELMQEAGISFRKEYGQNFLINPMIPEDIADGCADDSDRLILEIGPGIGCLTAQLCQRYRRVVAIEIDRGLIPVLERTLAEYDNVTVLNADVMQVDLRALVEQYAEGRPVSVAANLPYYITTPILMRLLESGVSFDSITVMVQQEVAARLCSQAGGRDYGAITAVLGYYGTVRRLFRVGAGCFLPAPKVDSAVIRIDLYKTPKYAPRDVAHFLRTVHAAFEMRRKTLLNALSAGLSLPKETVARAIEAVGLDPTVRGERLSTEQFVRLSDEILALLS